MNVNQNFFGGMGGNTGFFSDYASIRNGSYRRLLKAYYGGNNNSGTTAGTRSNRSNVLEQLLEERRNPKVSEQTKEANSKLLDGIPTLTNAVKALQKDATYTDSEDGKKSAQDNMVSALKNFVSEYNDVVSAAKKSTLSNKTSHVASMMKSTTENADKLKEIGISVNANGTLQFIEGQAKNADISKVQDLFSNKNSMSYGSTVLSRLQFAGITSGTVDSTKKEDNVSSVSSAASFNADIKSLASDALYEKVKDKNGKYSYDLDKIFSTAKSFVKNYNDMFDAEKSGTKTGVTSNLSYIKEKTEKNKDMLAQFGISLDANNKMTIDENTFKKSDMTKVQNFFKDYSLSVSTNVSLVDHYLTSMAKNANGYTSAGMYNVQGVSQFNDFI
uniref:Flagellar hook-associated protein 2 C-terminal domain-containing protein n=1 Tax=Eubacterium plexicaudatum ASF492 TaxID=1235802 RepID=N2A294_9FIRM